MSLESSKSFNYSVSEKRNKLVKQLQFSSSACAVTGGIILASNTSISGYGFIFLALSSSQMFIASFKKNDRSLMIYAGSIFLFVDCF